MPSAPAAPKFPSPTESATSNSASTRRMLGQSSRSVVRLSRQRAVRTLGAGV